VQAAAAAAKTINGMGGVTLEYKAEPKPPQSPVVKGTEELEHDAADFYPLPLQSRVVSPGMVLKRAPLVIRTLSGRTALGGSASLLRALKRVAPASPAAPPPPPKMAVREAALPRVRRLRVAGAARPDPGKAIPNMPAGVTPIPVPASPARRPELAVVRLRMVSAQRTPPRRSAMQQGTNRLVASPRRALAAPLAARQQGSAVSVQVAPGRASYVELSRQREVGGKVQLQAADPRQVVRAIFLGAYGRLVADRWVRGPQLLALPDRTRRLVLIGQDDEAPMFGHPGVSAPMGLEQDTLTVALERHSFAASGCVVEVLAGLDHSPPPLTAVSGREVLGNARHLVVHFPALQKGSAVLLLSAAAADPGPVAEQVRWRAAGADQGALRAVTRDDGAALVIPIASNDAWSLELTVGRDYRLDGVVALPGDPAQLAGDLARAAQWTLLDEKWSPVAARVRAPIAQALERVVTARVEVLP
ncbi:MAG TPA: hypothetical protein VFB81_14230, partial [Myxococcales bacterium]|nr:hypothetical protein [Myxococcales bacterium]